MNELAQIAKDLGAPTLIAILVLWRMESRIETLTRAVLALPLEIAKHVHTPEHMTRGRRLDNA